MGAGPLGPPTPSERNPTVTSTAYSRYINNGDRDPEARAANVAYNREAQARRRARIIAADPSLAPHGKETTYFNWRCPCDACREAHRVGQQARDKRRTRSEARDG